MANVSHRSEQRARIPRLQGATHVERQAVQVAELICWRGVCVCVMKKRRPMASLQPGPHVPVWAKAKTG